MLGNILFKLEQAADRLDAALTKHRIIFSALIAAVLCSALALYNVSSGPLHNLNDIGGWSNRALFIIMSAAVHGALLMGCAMLSDVRCSRTALRQVILTTGYFILLLAINQKSYLYVNVLLPLVREMDGSFAAGMQADVYLSAPAKLLVYLITRGPVYDMYMLKLFAIGCYLVTALLLTRAADRNGLGIRAEVLLALCVILPQGFMNMACSAMAVLGMALALGRDGEKKRVIAAAVCYGAACALCGACLLALPVMIDKKNWKCQITATAGVMLALCVPAVLSGVPAAKAVGSLFGAVLGMPVYAGGAPGIVNLFPRALLEEIPQYAAILRHLPSLDPVTNSQPHYTAEHHAYLVGGFAWAGLAAYMGLCALLAHRGEGKTPLHRAFALMLGALLVCPGVTSGAWLAVDLLCLYVLLAAPGLRLPACVTLFATAAGSCYPMTEEVLLPMIYALALCLTALCMLLDVIPMNLMENEETSHE